MDVKAYDLGEPSLSSVTTVPIYVRHTATVPPEVGLGFADDLYSIEVPENATARQLIKTLVVINGRAHNGAVPLKCDIISGNNEGKGLTPGKSPENWQLCWRPCFFLNFSLESTLPHRLKKIFFFFVAFFI